MPSNESKKKSTSSRLGICALLREEGVYAKSHLLPRALTSPDVPGALFIEAGRGVRPIKRPTSWYDYQLVSAAGEKILSELDSAGISELRKHQLVWSGWRKKNKPIINDYISRENPLHKPLLRSIHNVNATSLRLFFLSILWRSLSTKREEFAHLENIGVDLEALREMLINRDPGTADYYPVCLSQISTLGPAHNQTPTIQEIEFPFDTGIRAARYYRFYMQGVIAHMYPSGCEDIFNTCPASFIGGDTELLVFTRPFQDSWQLENMESEINETRKLWPDLI